LNADWRGLWLRISKEGRHVKKALITGVTGQDGSYHAELLLANREKALRDA